MKSPRVFIGQAPVRDLKAKAGADTRALMTIDQAAAHCCCSRRTIQTEMAAGNLRFVRLSKRTTRIDPVDLAEYLDNRKRGGTRPAGGDQS